MNLHFIKKQKTKNFTGKCLLLFLALTTLLITLSCGKAVASSDDSWKAIKKGDIVLGNPNANVVIIEYFDLACPACAAAHKSIESAWRLIKDDVALVARHFPLTQIHPNAYLAAQYLEASRKFDAFFAYQTKLYNMQRDWSNNSNPEKMFLQYAAELNLNPQQLQEEFQKVKASGRIEEDMASGEAAQITGTPSFFINGEKTPFPQNGEALYLAVQEAKRKLTDSQQ